MNRKLILGNSLRMMFRNKLRTLFMSFGVMIGVATLIAGQSLAAGAEKQIKQRVNKVFGPGTIYLVSRTLTYADVAAVEASMDQVIASSPRFGGAESEISYQGINRQAAVYGHTDKGDYVWNRGVTDGRFFTTEDLAKTARVALIGHRLAEVLFGEGVDPIGEEIQLASSPFRVIGILESAGIDPHGEDRDEDVFVPITTAMRRLNNTEYIGVAKLVVANHETIDEDADQISAILRNQHNIAQGEQEDFAIYTSKFAGRMILQANRVLNVYMMAAAGVVLLVAAIVIASIMLVVVRERIAEIGLRKAVGATEKNIGFQFLTETVVITVTSGVLGMGLGLLAANLASTHIDMPVIVTLKSVVLCLTAALLVGIVSGIAPARRAARLDPVEALR
ncbi:MAG: FtsX-like permease family protein [Xanthomonadales bacterium]|nr:FtsX-like permease family protein [Xanthomonadales bacterium]